ncbi:hypothetical protein P153DRAFT_400376 [Dothidotthia symphoricarpi CBS 119687]|uniref:Uncharacterized protein n=1 Tax=Dothidotthia symphoricarpi CBS 119687 TaxID=1392245 RepID=A0A6A6A382_9PLEO|nr:uncharacterized protein P153DRAFT_400376 [Dothidotthia symphoricarpi CBS 119687]KAF2125574.1 hypothetical protein P153DRAFT_400376 [Dothidotthia symphoricarpi CBS 119687]
MQLILLLGIAASALATPLSMTTLTTSFTMTTLLPHTLDPQQSLVPGGIASGMGRQETCGGWDCIRYCSFAGDGSKNNKPVCEWCLWPGKTGTMSMGQHNCALACRDKKKSKENADKCLQCSHNEWSCFSK